MLERFSDFFKYFTISFRIYKIGLRMFKFFYLYKINTVSCDKYYFMTTYGIQYKLISTPKINISNYFIAQAHYFDVIKLMIDFHDYIIYE